MSEVALYVKAAGLIAKGFTKGVYARDKDGTEVSYADDRACQFCTSGAIRRAAQDLGVNEYTAHRPAERASALLNGDVIPTWNDKDDRTQGEAVAFLLRVAADLAEKDAA